VQPLARRRRQETHYFPVQQNVKKNCHRHNLDALMFMLVTAAAEGDLKQVEVLVEDGQIHIAPFIVKCGINSLHIAYKSRKHTNCEMAY